MKIWQFANMPLPIAIANLHNNNGLLLQSKNVRERARIRKEVKSQQIFSYNFVDVLSYKFNWRARELVESIEY